MNEFKVKPFTRREAILQGAKLKAMSREDSFELGDGTYSPITSKEAIVKEKGINSNVEWTKVRVIVNGNNLSAGTVSVAAFFEHQETGKYTFANQINISFAKSAMGVSTILYLPKVNDQYFPICYLGCDLNLGGYDITVSHDGMESFLTDGDFNNEFVPTRTPSHVIYDCPTLILDVTQGMPK